MYGRLDQVGKKLKCGDCGRLNVVPPPPPPKKPNIPAALEGEQYELWDADEQPLPSELVAHQPKYIAVTCRKCATLMYATMRTEAGDYVDVKVWKEAPKSLKEAVDQCRDNPAAPFWDGVFKPLMDEAVPK